MNRTQNAMLTETDREFLRDPDGYYTGPNAKQQRYERRQNIKRRLRESLFDLALLLDTYDEHEALIKDVFGYDEQTQDAISDAIGLIFCAVTDRLEYGGHTPGYFDGPTGFRMGGEVVGSGGHQSPDFLLALGDGLAQGYLKADNVLLEHLEVTTETTRIPSASLQRDLEEGKTLHPDAIAMLLKSGEIDGDAISEFARQQLLDSDNGDDAQASE